MGKLRTRHASLFSGIGAPELAAAMLGWENVFHCEINPFGRRVLEYWFPESDSYEDVKKTDFTKYRGRLDVLSAGIPCQPFSSAGKRKGADDDRYLWPEALRVIGEVRPAWVVIENVAGIITMVEPVRDVEVGCQAPLFGEGDDIRTYERIGTFTVERICSDLERAGYSVQPVLVPACAVGAPHRRDRVFFLAHLDAEDSFDNGCGKREHEKKRSTRNDRDSCTGDPERICSEERVINASDSDGLVLQGRYGEAEEGRGVAGFGTETLRGEADGPDCDRDEVFANEGRLDARDDSFPGFGGWKYREGREYTPSVPAVHVGDDGIPFDLADLAIPFGKWREEAIKACGNAIVVPVIYEIFKAIDGV